MEIIRCHEGCAVGWVPCFSRKLLAPESALARNGREGLMGPRHS